MHSIFDPTGGNTEHGGSRFTPPDADQYSQLPESFTNPPFEEVTGTVDFTAPPEKPPIEVSTENNGKLVIVHISGTLHASDYRKFVPVVEDAIRKNGTVRIFVQMHHFHGWDAGALWEDVKFDMDHVDDIDRLAIVGETGWEKWMAVFCKPFTMATIQYFPTAQAASARAWLLAP
jgi:hypothetical protein